MARVLVVEDDPSIRYLLEVVLSADGHQVVQAETAREALEYLRRETPDLIVLDVVMPGMDGLTLLGRIRAVRRVRVRTTSLGSVKTARPRSSS